MSLFNAAVPSGPAQLESVSLTKIPLLQLDYSSGGGKYDKKSLYITLCTTPDIVTGAGSVSKLIFM